MARIFSFLALAVTVTATFAPDEARADDKKIAQQIADVMKATGVLKNYDILVTYSNGSAQLQGTVTTEQQMRTAIEITQASPHVKKVVNKLAISQAPGAPVAIKPAPPLDRPVRISPVVAEKPRSVAPRQQPAPQPRIVAASLQNQRSNGPVFQAAQPTRVSPPPVAAAPLAPPVVTAPATAFSRPVPMGPSSLASPVGPGQMPPQMADPRIAQMRMAQMQMADPRMADPRMAQMQMADPRMAQMQMADPRMAQMRMAQMQMADPRMAQMMPPQQPLQAAPQPQQSRSAMAALAAPFAAVAAPLAAMAPQGGMQNAAPQECDGTAGRDAGPRTATGVRSRDRWRSRSGRIRPAAVAGLCLADLRTVSELCGADLSQTVLTDRLAVHRALLPVSPGTAGMAEGHPGMG